MAVQTTTPPALHANSTFQEDVDHWTHRLKTVTANTQSLELEGSKSWSSSFFGCFDPIDTCAITCCLPCVTFGKTHHRLHKDPSLKGWSPVNASCLGLWASAYCCLSWLPVMLQRNEIRKRSQPHLEGDTVTDCLKAWCCGCCDLVQQDKEAEHLLGSNQYVTEQPGAVSHEMSYGAPQNAVTAPGYQQETKPGL